MHADNNQQYDILITGGKRTGAETRREQNPPGTTNQHEKASCNYHAYDAGYIDTPLFREMPN